MRAASSVERPSAVWRTAPETLAARSEVAAAVEEELVVMAVDVVRDEFGIREDLTPHFDVCRIILDLELQDVLNGVNSDFPAVGVPNLVVRQEHGDFLRPLLFLQVGDRLAQLSLVRPVGRPVFEFSA